VVIRTPLLPLLFAFSLLLVACGGSDEPDTATRRPEAIERPASASSGPTASVEPHSAAPGEFITVSGTQWPPGVLIDVTGLLPAGVKADPYATTTTDQSGAFQVRFRLEKTPDGQDLEVGRFDIIVRSKANEVDIPFVIETRRPIQNSGPGG
jgi:hypothetical protein